jgi:hypothetical protein
LLVPLGAEIAHGHLPKSIAYATALTGDWHDVAALGQLVFWASYHAFGGLRGLVVAQTIAAAIAFGALAHGLSRETSRGGVLAVSAIVLAGSLAAVMVTAAALFSLAFFAVLLALLESGPTRRSIWWSVPLLALWGNLHGGVLAGWALLACYLVFSRGRREPGLVILVLAAATVALGANPSFWHTPDYYRGVFQSEVAQRGDGLWAPLGFGPLDLLSILAAVGLGALVLRRWDRIGLWEIVAIVGLVAATVHVARNGVSLLFVAAYPAARGLQIRSPSPRLVAAAAAVFAVGAVAALARGPADPGSKRLAHIAAQGRPVVLADAILGQQVVLVGGRVWVENPIDAFRRSDQSLYLDWLAGRPSGDKAAGHADFVLVRPTSAAGRRAARDSRLTRVSRTADAVLYRVKNA